MSELPLAELLADLPNPFDSTVVGTAWDQDVVDVPEIHEGAFNQCIRLLHEMRQSRTLLMYGEAGSGKTHFLARLRAVLTEEKIPVCAVLMHTSSAMIWRHLRRELVRNLLMHGPDGVTQLDHLLAMRGEQIEAVTPRSLSAALAHLANGRMQRDSQAWLRGDPLPDAALDRMGVGREDPDDDSVEDHARQIVLSLIRFAEPAPVVLCLDQVEALLSHPDDTSGIYALGRLVTDLRGQLANVLVIACVQTAFIEKLNVTLREADKDRLLRDQRASLSPLHFEQAKVLIASRLDVLGALRDHPSRKLDPLWPVDAQKLRLLFGAQDACVARKVLFGARELFEEARGRRTTEAGVTEEQFVANQFEQRREAAWRELRPEASEQTLLDGIPLLLHATGWKLTDPGPAGRDLHKTGERGGQKIAIAIVNQEHTGSVARKLGRILEGSQVPPGYRLVLLRDARLGIGSGAQVTNRRLGQVAGSGGAFLPVGSEALAALEALRSLLANAESGDLSHRGETVGAAFVEHWMLKNMPPPLESILGQFAGEGSPVEQKQKGELQAALIELLNRRRVVDVSTAAHQTGKSEEEVTACARESVEFLGLAEGGTPALFSLVAADGGH